PFYYDYLLKRHSLKLILLRAAVQNSQDVLSDLLTKDYCFHWLPRSFYRSIYLPGSLNRHCNHRITCQFYYSVSQKKNSYVYSSPKNFYAMRILISQCQDGRNI